MSERFRKGEIHTIHPFPARMAPSVVRHFLPEGGPSLRVLDPMAGSGTSLVNARARGHRALGCDTDPLALLISRAWCADVEPARLVDRGVRVLARARSLSERLPARLAYPEGADAETKRFIRSWFGKANRTQLAALSTCIARVRDHVYKDLLWCALSRTIITKQVGVSLAIDVSHSRPHRHRRSPCRRPFDEFPRSVRYIAQHAPFQGGRFTGPAVDVRSGDARALPFKTRTVDAIVTSPPYLNAIDYLRGHKFSLVWMGHAIGELRSLRGGSVGAERMLSSPLRQEVDEAVTSMGNLSRLDARLQGMIRRYATDMQAVLFECKRVLKPKGQAVLVIGDSMIRGVYVKNSEGLIALAASLGFDLVSKETRRIPDERRYMPPPSIKTSGHQMRRRMREEVILQFMVS